jgi:hypothetical protein
VLGVSRISGFAILSRAVSFLMPFPFNRTCQGVDAGANKTATILAVNAAGGRVPEVGVLGSFGPFFTISSVASIPAFFTLTGPAGGKPAFLPDSPTLEPVSLACSPLTYLVGA